MDNNTENEVILREDAKRLAIFPIKYQRLWDLYKKSVSAFWTCEEIDFSKDLYDWENKLNDDERYFISHVLGFFSQSDALVNDNIMQNFMNDVKITEALCFYGFQQMIENVHGETYSLMIETFIKDPEEKDKLFNAVTEVPCIKKKADWTMKYIANQDISFAERLVAFACVEGIFFSGSFASIFWLKKRGLMQGLCFSNELISRDEGLHFEFASVLYDHLEYTKLSKERFTQIVTEAVEIEIEFLREALPVKLIGINSDLMTQYIKYVSDCMFFSFGYEKHYLVENPFDFMVNLSIDGKTNYFEKKVSEYSRSGVMAGMNGENQHEFSINEDF